MDRCKNTYKNLINQKGDKMSTLINMFRNKKEQKTNKTQIPDKRANVYLSVRLPRDINDDLVELSAKTDIDIQTHIMLAVCQYLVSKGIG